ncbi:head GIN domain-containing protein [Pedobacter frigoris]|uniref:DUF2807 domain-containing protein n=1 Tax=Pedobacter frigoris TaxID=2571272 RepID=A0A4U1CDQ0_9SPHI|nr:head GIN domain-containing protein [Pedobacter frigoris]TKC04452.1 DUF2807 domain-containing protein [Pedobacter frigoris]
MKNPYVLKSLFTFLTLLSIAIVANAQQSKTVPISNFNQITVSSGIDLYLTQSTAENIRVSAHPDLLKNVVIEKEGSTLHVKYKNNISWSKLFKGQDIKVYVNYKQLQSISASGGSDVYTQNTLKADKLSINASGGADLKLNAMVKNIDINSSGGADIDLKGSASNMQIDVSGGSDIDALGFVVEYAKVNASGGSDTNINVTKALEANASGGSDINYKGNASVRKTSSGKSGEVSRID